MTPIAPQPAAARPGVRICSDPGTRRRRRAAALLAVLASAALSGCYVLPIDPRTGTPVLPAAPAEHRPPPAAPVAPPQAATGLLLQARLYPLNETANRAGLLTAQVADTHGGRGSFSLLYHGQPMQGEATRVDAGFAGFGRIHDEVLGPASRSYAGRRGIANAYGAQGVNAQCEYLLTGPSIGTGVCLFSDGARYQMHF